MLKNVYAENEVCLCWGNLLLALLHPSHTTAAGLRAESLRVCRNKKLSALSSGCDALHGLVFTLSLAAVLYSGHRRLIVLTL